MKISRNYLNKPHRIYGGANILKWSDIPRVFAPLGAIFLGYSPPKGDIPRNIALLLRGGEYPGGGGESPVTTAWANSSNFLKILSCPLTKYEFAPQMPPQILRSGAATTIGQ
jgi:hypothetical protein